MGAASFLQSIRSGKVSAIDYKYTSSLFSPDGRVAAWRSHAIGTLGLCNIESGKDVAVLGYSGNPCKSMAMCWPHFIEGMESGVLSVYSFENVTQGPAIVTPVRLWLFGLYGQAGRWDTEITTVCERCGTRFPAPPGIIDAIRQIAKAASLADDAVPSLELPDGAWDEPKLVSECPGCRRPLRYNPFLVDNRDRLAGHQAKPLEGARSGEKATPVPDLPVWPGASAPTE